ncbi:MAG TPA: hypothetical protein VHG93_21665 [Longimicrobium sp.]|nr:hypothetical protein [Longimicrobium sp.]
METRVLVRVQARGGKFIGPDGGYALVTLREAVSGEILAQRIATGGSGQLSATFGPGASREVIVTPATPVDTVQWLSAPAGQPTAGLLATLDLHRPTLVEFSAETLANGVPNGHVARQQMWLTPGLHLDQEPGVVLVMPGLSVQILSPGVANPPSGFMDVTAWVAMMCGCKISSAAGSPWVPESFQVTARVRAVGGDFHDETPLTYQTTSTFTTKEPIKLPAGAGNYEVVVDAVQVAEGNVGSASYFFAVAG